MEERQTTSQATEHAGQPPPTQPPPTQPPPPEPARSSRPRLPLLCRFAVAVVLLVALAAAVFLIWKMFFAKRGVPESIVILSGRIEGDDSAIAPKTLGRVIEIRFREGDFVKAGETIAI